MSREMRAPSSRTIKQEGFKAVELRQFNQRTTAENDFKSPSTQQKREFNPRSDFIRSVMRDCAPHPFGWWWEFGAIIVSLCSITLIIAILLAMNGKPLQHWRLPIQINSLVAVFSTFSRSALLVVLTEGLSQLKWNYFEKQASTLDRLQTFDDASRGPWGALVFLLKIKKREFCSLAAIGATLTVLALALEPFTQQILEFPSREISILNETAHVYAAETFALREWSRSSQQGGPKHTMLLSIIDLLPDPSAGIDSHFVCPTGDCEMPAHWSLAACTTDCENSFQDQDALHCTYYEVGGETSFNLEDFISYSIAMGPTEYSRKFKNFTAECWELEFPFVNPGQPNRRWDITQPFTFGLWFKYHSDTEAEESEKFTNNDIVTINATVLQLFPNYEDLSQWTGITSNTTGCKIRYCIKETASTILKKGSIQTNDLYEELPLAFSNPCGTDTNCPNITATFQRQNNETRSIQIDTKLRVRFGDDVAEIFNRAVDMEVTETYLSGFEAQDMAKLMGTVLSSFLRSSQNTKATNLTGSTIFMETYVRVKWEWATFPVIIVLASVGFLILTILDSRSGDQLFKSSVLTGFFVRWEGARESKLGKERQYNYTDLLQEGKESRVRLTKNEDGELIFVSDDT